MQDATIIAFDSDDAQIASVVPNALELAPLNLSQSPDVFLQSLPIPGIPTAARVDDKGDTIIHQGPSHVQSSWEIFNNVQDEIVVQNSKLIS